MYIGCLKSKVFLGLSPSPEVVSEGPCTDGDVVVRHDEDSCDQLTPCSKIFSPVCANDGVANITFTNECKLKQEMCTKRSTIRVSFR